MIGKVLRLVALLSLPAACGGTLDAGAELPRGPLPVDQQNPIVLSNDGARDNWAGELALTLASSGAIRLLGLIVNSSPAYPTLDDNVASWQAMLQAARDSGMRNVPQLTVSADDPPLQRPADGDIASTQPNGSAGAQLIVEAARRSSTPLRPISVVVGGRLTEVADAYLMDPSVADHVVVLASLGHAGSTSAGMGAPNGDIDPWADEIVSRKFRYVQIVTYYAQQNDIPSSLVSALPDNAFGSWVSAKLSDILPYPEYAAADQNSLSAAAFPDFTLEVLRMSEASVDPPSAGAAPLLAPALDGSAWIVTRADTALATARFRQALTDAKTYGAL